ncbi:hypothetical protein QTO30_00940 [Yoonia sp. GPGPB17]|uniref:alpha/beta fold hydrolase n=1 Tax=Yoonia sp. GPGPB17 TaxID=3026147 RepID=UPI0030C185E7
MAAKAVGRLLAQGYEIAGLVLISTGAPVRDLRAFEAAAPSIRRSFLAAHSASAALRLGYRSAAHLFRSGRIGEDLIIDFFVRDSPADANALADPNLRETLRSNLAYCFEDADQIVSDVATWGQDWSATLAQVASAIPVTFIHGTENTVQDIASLRTLCAETPRITLHEIGDQGQMALYQSPGRIAAWIAEIA